MLINERITQENICNYLYYNELKDNNLVLYLDLSSGNIIFKEGVNLNETELLISCYVVPQRKTKRNLKEFAKPVKSAYLEYRKGHTICKTTAIKTYGKKFVETQQPFVTLKNPYYKCSEPMKLFDTEALEYNYSIFKNNKD